MIFIVNMVKSGIVGLFGLLLIICTILIFWSFTSENPTFPPGVTVFSVLAFLGVVVAALFGTAIMISIHDRLLAISDHLERIADAATSLSDPASQSNVRTNLNDE